MTAVSIFAVLEIIILAINVTKASKCKEIKVPPDTFSFFFDTAEQQTLSVTS